MTTATEPKRERGVHWLRQDHQKAWRQAVVIAHESNRGEDEARALLAQSMLLAAEQLAADRKAGERR